MGSLVEKLRWKLALLISPLRPMSGAETPEGEKKDESGGSSGEGEPKGTGEKSGEGEPKGEPKSGSGKEPYDREEDERIRREDDWKTKARKHENEAKKLREEKERLEREAKERADETKTQHERDIDKAREDAIKSEREKAAAARREDRLENSVIRLAAKGIRIGEGDEKKTVRFQDPEDALLHLRREISRGVVSESDVFDSDGNVQEDAVRSALTELIEEKAYLRAGDSNEKKEEPTPKGSADGGKGAGESETGGKSLEEMSTEEHFQRVRKHRDSDTGKIREVGPK